jgi:hypothetical protein
MAKEEIAVLEAFRDHIAKTTGVKALLEPQPVKLHEPHLRIMAPTGWDCRFEDWTTNETAKLYTVKLDALVTLTAYGDGPDVYLGECLNASFKVNRYFRDPVGIPIVSLVKGAWKASGAGSITVTGQRKHGGQHFKNEDEAKGEKPYLYEENFEVSIYFPYAELTENQ